MSGLTTGSPAEDVAVLASKVGTASSTPLASGAADMSKFTKALVIVTFADMATETIDVKLQSVDADGTTNAADLVPAKAITQLASSAAANDNKAVVLGLKIEDLIPSGKRYFRALVTTGGATGGSTSITILGFGARYSPATDFDNALVVQIVR